MKKILAILLALMLLLTAACAFAEEDDEEEEGGEGEIIFLDADGITPEEAEELGRKARELAERNSPVHAKTWKERLSWWTGTRC